MHRNGACDLLWIFHLCFALFVSIMDNDPFTHELGGVLLKFQILLSADELCLHVRCKLQTQMTSTFPIVPPKVSTCKQNRCIILKCILAHKVATTSIDGES